MKFYTIDPTSVRDRLLLQEVWEWAQRRKLLYCDTGGEMTLQQYLLEAEALERKHIWVQEQGNACVVTVELTLERCFTIHVTAPKKTPLPFTLKALLAIRRMLFEDLDAECIYTSCGTFHGHKHKAVFQLAEWCGMTPTGLTWDDETQDGTPVHWREYAITREQYYGRSENNQHERLRILSETDVARAARLSGVATGA